MNIKIPCQRPPESHKEIRWNQDGGKFCTRYHKGPFTSNICVCVFRLFLPSRSWKCKCQVWTPSLVDAEHILEFWRKRKRRRTCEQECIPVGCVPPASVAVSVGEGVSAWGCVIDTPLGRHPSAHCMLGYTHPYPLHAGIHIPLWIEWQTGVKTLPYPKLRLRAVKRFKERNHVSKMALFGYLTTRLAVNTPYSN